MNWAFCGIILTNDTFSVRGIIIYTWIESVWHTSNLEDWQGTRIVAFDIKCFFEVPTQILFLGFLCRLTSEYLIFEFGFFVWSVSIYLFSPRHHGSDDTNMKVFKLILAKSLNPLWCVFFLFLAYQNFSLPDWVDVEKIFSCDF